MPDVRDSVELTSAKTKLSIGVAVPLSENETDQAPKQRRNWRERVYDPRLGAPSTQQLLTDMPIYDAGLGKSTFHDSFQRGHWVGIGCGQRLSARNAYASEMDGPSGETILRAAHLNPTGSS